MRSRIASTVMLVSVCRRMGSMRTSWMAADSTWRRSVGTALRPGICNSFIREKVTRSFYEHRSLVGLGVAGNVAAYDILHTGYNRVILQANRPRSAHRGAYARCRPTGTVVSRCVTRDIHVCSH